MLAIVTWLARVVIRAVLRNEHDCARVADLWHIAQQFIQGNDHRFVSRQVIRPFMVALLLNVVFTLSGLVIFGGTGDLVATSLLAMSSIFMMLQFCLAIPLAWIAATALVQARRSVAQSASAWTA